MLSNASFSRDKTEEIKKVPVFVDGKLCSNRETELIRSFNSEQILQKLLEYKGKEEVVLEFKTSGVLSKPHSYSPIEVIYFLLRKTKDEIEKDQEDMLDFYKPFLEEKKARIRKKTIATYYKTYVISLFYVGFLLNNLNIEYVSMFFYNHEKSNAGLCIKKEMNLEKIFYRRKPNLNILDRKIQEQKNTHKQKNELMITSGMLLDELECYQKDLQEKAFFLYISIGNCLIRIDDHNLFPTEDIQKYLCRLLEGRGFANFK